VSSRSWRQAGLRGPGRPCFRDGKASSPQPRLTKRSALVSAGAGKSGRDDTGGLEADIGRPDR